MLKFVKILLRNVVTSAQHEGEIEEMASTSRHTISNVELDGIDHVLWKYKIQNILISKKLLKVVEGHEKPFTNKVELKIY